MRSELARAAALLQIAFLFNACSLPPPPRLRSVPPPAPAFESRFIVHEAWRPDAPTEVIDGVTTTDPVTVDQVVASIEIHLPALLAARQEIEAAEGQLLAASGGFDPVLRGKSRLNVQGFYESERVDVEVEQPTTLWGTSLFSGYRLGEGDFAIYDGKAKTNESGEVRVGARVSLLEGRTIDKRRVALWKARLARGRADPELEAKRLAFIEKGTLAYWKWRAAGGKLRIARDLLALARSRQEWLQVSVDEGLLPGISLIDNERLLLEREALELGAVRELEAAAFGLSLYLRDPDGNPLRVDMARMPEAFPEVFPLEETSNVGGSGATLDDAIATAISRRPELRRIELDLEAARLELAFQENRRQPKLDVEVFASQDLGSSTNSIRDKDPFEVGVGVSLELPLLLRDARGRVREARAKEAKLLEEARWARDLIEAEVRDSVSALTRVFARIGIAARGVELALRMENAEREQLEAGNSDVLRVNLREDQRAKAEASLVEARAGFFAALATYRAALALPSP